jgi:hypothetical protein
VAQEIRREDAESRRERRDDLPPKERPSRDAIEEKNTVPLALVDMGDMQRLGGHAGKFYALLAMAEVLMRHASSGTDRKLAMMSV